jgi:exopolysaccharide biosynthesis protein
MKEKNPFEPYIKEKSEDKIEDTNSFLLNEEMFLDRSFSTFSQTQEKKQEEILSYVEMPILDTEGKTEIIEIPEEKKEKRKGANLIILSLLFLPSLFVLILIGLHSNTLISKSFLSILYVLFFLFMLLFIGGIVLHAKKENKLPAKSKVFKILFSIFMFFYIVGCGTFSFIMYGPNKGFRDWLIPTAMTTMTHQYFATWFYDSETIESVLDQNTIIESGEDTDLNLISVGNLDFDATTYANEYEKEILTKDKGNDIYKVIDIEGSGYKGHMVVVYDPARIKVATTKYLNVKGQYVTDMAADNKALLAINGGGFIDPNYSSNGGTPQGIVIQNGKVVSDRPYSKSGGLIGFTKENKLILGKMTSKEALAKGVRDAVTFGPFLIVNGQKSFIKGNGGWGTAPRTAIGQRKDGIVLLLVIDGRKLKYPGADMVDLTEIMEKYGAYNAANLDGGTSSVMVFPEEKAKQFLTTKELQSHCTNKYCYINDPIDGGGSHETRWVASSIIVK